MPSLVTIVDGVVTVDADKFNAINTKGDVEEIGSIEEFETRRAFTINNPSATDDARYLSNNTRYMVVR